MSTTMAATEPYRTTPLPLPPLEAEDGGTTAALHVTYDPNAATATDSTSSNNQNNLQQAIQHSIANFDATICEECLFGSSVIAVNQSFCVYAVKKGLVRIVHRPTTMRGLFRPHSGQIVTDIQFFQDGDVLATAGYTASTSNTSNNVNQQEQSPSSSKVVVWRVFERSPDIHSEILLEIPTSFSQLRLTRIIWHPFNTNQFWIMHQQRDDNYDDNNVQQQQQQKEAATLVETTRISTSPHSVHGYPVAQQQQQQQQNPYGAQPQIPPLLGLHDGAIVLQHPEVSTSLTDLQWSEQDTRYIVAGYDNGDIGLFDLKQTTMADSNTNTNVEEMPSMTIRIPQMVQKVTLGQKVTRLLLLPHEMALLFPQQYQYQQEQRSLTTCFVTGSNRNRDLTFWSSFVAPNPTTTTTNAVAPPPPPQQLQVVSIQPEDGDDDNNDGNDDDSSYLLDVCHGPAPATAAPPSCFVLSCARHNSRVYAWHVRAEWSSNSTIAGNNNNKKALLRGCDYVVPIAMSNQTNNPTYSYTTKREPAADISEEELNEQGGLIFDMVLFAMQKHAVVANTITSYMCLPPSKTYTHPTIGVTVKERSIANNMSSKSNDGDKAGNDIGNGSPSAAAAVSDIDENEFEEYDVGEDDEEDDLVDEAPDPSSLPNPNGPSGTAPAVSSSSLSNNPFTNWLGAIAAKSTGNDNKKVAPVAAAAAASNNKNASPDGPPPTKLPPPPDVTPPPHSQQPSPPPPKPSAFLSPAEIMSSSRGDTPTISNTTSADDRDSAYASSKEKKKKAVKSTTPQRDHPVAILQKARVESASSGVRTDPNSITHNATNSNGNLLEEIRRMVREEIQASVLPAIRQQRNQPPASTSPDTIAALQKLQSSVDSMARQDIAIDHDRIAQSMAGSVHHPLNAAFAESLKTVLIPSLESVTHQILQQVSVHLEQSTSQQTERNADEDGRLDSISKQLSTMTALVAELSKEVQSLRVASAAAAAAAASPPPLSHAAPNKNPEEEQRATIQRLLHESKYEEAFTMAVSIRTVAMTLFCCRNADLQAVLGGAEPTLSQPILLCLMQQLGTTLVTINQNAQEEANNLNLALEWLQEIALSLDLTDVNLQQHVPVVLQEVVKNITQRMNETTDNPVLRRQLQRMLQVVRGMQMG